MKINQPTNFRATKTLVISVKTWFVVVSIGQLIFAVYILLLYGKNGAVGNLEKWNSQTPHGYQLQDLTGNVIFGIHVALAAIITLGGPIQLVPKIREIAPKLHRVSGRIYVFSAFIISFAGLYLSWVRGSVGGLTGSVFITINGLIIMVCAFNAVNFAMKRQFEQHYKWAVRLFLAVSGVWLFRVCLMLWLAIHQTPVGFDPETFEGPFLNFLYVLVYVSPPFLAEFYFRAKTSENAVFNYGVAGFLMVVTIGLAIGIFAATMGMWLPVL